MIKNNDYWNQNFWVNDCVIIEFKATEMYTRTGYSLEETNTAVWSDDWQLTRK